MPTRAPRQPRQPRALHAVAEAETTPATPADVLDKPLYQQHIAGLQMRVAEIARTEHLLVALRTELAVVLQENYGVDTVHEYWNLDLGAGLLRKLPNP